MQLLPKWCITNKYPAILDTESKTVIEQTARVYGAMQTLIDEYNTFADSVNEIIEEYETGATKDNEEFRVALRQEFQDFIDVINLKVMAQDKEIGDRFNAIVEEINNRFADNDEYLKNFAESLTNEMRAKMEEQDNEIAEAVSYMKEKVTETVINIINNMVENGKINDAILEGFNEIETRLTETVARVDEIETQIATINGTLETLLSKYEELATKQATLEKELQFESTKTGNGFSLDDASEVPFILLEAENTTDEEIVFDKIIMSGKNIVNFKNAPDTVQGTVGMVVYTKQANGSFARVGGGKLCQDAFLWGDGTVEGKNSDLNITFKKGEFIFHRDCVLYFYFPHNESIVINANIDEENHHACVYEFYQDAELIAVRFPNTGNGTSYNDILFPMVAKITEEEYNLVDSEENLNPIEWEEYNGVEINVGTVNIYNPVTGLESPNPVTLTPRKVTVVNDVVTHSGKYFTCVNGVYGLQNLATDEFLPVSNSDEFLFLTPLEGITTIYATGRNLATEEDANDNINLFVKYYNNSKNGKRFGEFHKCALLCNHE